MRVISGIHKGRQLKSVPGKNTRPTTDKVKESVFQMIGPFFEDGQCLDLFAGSGSLGLEAISRGMDSCIFVDKFPIAVQTVKENIRLLKLEKVTEVYRADAFRALHAVRKRGLKFRLIFLDPPYHTRNYEEFLTIIKEYDLLTNGGLVYCEHNPSDGSLLNQTYPILKRVNYSRTIGVTIYQKD